MAPLSRRDLLLGMTASAAIATLAACVPRTPDPAPASTPPASPSGSPTPDAIVDTLPELALTRRYGSAELGFDSNLQALVGAMLLVRDDGFDSGDTGSLVVVDAATGERRWTMVDAEARLEAAGSRLHPSTPSRLSVSQTAGVVAAETYVDECSTASPCPPGTGDVDEGLGVAALDVATGDVRWHTRMSAGDDVRVAVVGCDDARFIVDVGLQDSVTYPFDAPAAPTAATIVALDVADGSTAWERAGTTAVHVGVAVVGHERIGGEQRVVALDPETGATIWQGEPGETLGTRGRAMVALDDAAAGTSRIVDLATGATIVADADQSTSIGADVDGADLAAWTVRDDAAQQRTRTLWTCDASGDARPAATAVDDDHGGFTTSVADGYVWMEEEVGRIAPFDRSGAQRAAAVTGQRTTIHGDGWIVVATRTGFDLYDVA